MTSDILQVYDNKMKVSRHVRCQKRSRHIDGCPHRMNGAPQAYIYCDLTP